MIPSFSSPNPKATWFATLTVKQWKYSRTPVTRTLEGNEKQFELAGNSSYRGKFQANFYLGKGNLVRISGKFELSRFYCNKQCCFLLFCDQ